MDQVIVGILFYLKCLYTRTFFIKILSYLSNENLIKKKINEKKIFMRLKPVFLNKDFRK